MTKEEYLARHITMKRLLDIFGGMDGGISFMDLRSFVDTAEGEAISKVLSNMGVLLDVANVATNITIDDLPELVIKNAEEKANS
ncbi:hypothetical protein [Salmonella phage GSW6]|uniref:Uncharacterized protein n=1 Tax=Salmonella phage GSW6 TaxID=3025422 RepID=A0AAE9YK53_9CAUD|nr:hypothetical protein [Salmonella phage GSW6]